MAEEYKKFVMADTLVRATPRIAVAEALETGDAKLLNLPKVDIQATLKERESTHGSFVQVADLAQQIKQLFRYSKNWDRLPRIMRESLELDATKTARILCGDFAVKDHWKDKAGYATLVADTLKD